MSSIDVINLSILHLRMILMVIGNLKLCCQMFGLSPTSSRTLEKMLKLRQDKYSVQKQLMKKCKQNIQLTQSARNMKHHNIVKLFIENGARWGWRHVPRTKRTLLGLSPTFLRTLEKIDFNSYWEFEIVLPNGWN